MSIGASQSIEKSGVSAEQMAHLSQSLKANKSGG